MLTGTSNVPVAGLTPRPPVHDLWPPRISSITVNNEGRSDLGGMRSQRVNKSGLLQGAFFR
jgi:hypothetical protein